MKRELSVGIVGATSLAGRELLTTLERLNFPVGKLKLFSSAKSAGELLNFKNGACLVLPLEPDSLTDLDLVFFTTSSKIAKKFAPIAVENDSTVIDTSDAFRLDPEVPLIIPEINGHLFPLHSGIIASPSCSTIALSMVLNPINKEYGINRVVACSLHSVSELGKAAMDELYDQVIAICNFRDVPVSIMPHRIAFNCIPSVGGFMADGSSVEEHNLELEMAKIFGDSIKVTSTAVRVPVFIGNSIAVNVQCNRQFNIKDIYRLMEYSPGVALRDDPENEIYPIITEGAGSDSVFVGRIRVDKTIENGLNLWIVTDNLLKGLALNAVQIAELMYKNN